MSDLKETAIQAVTGCVSFETAFALFLFAGVYKPAPYLKALPPVINLTAIFVVLSFLVAVGLVLQDDVRPQRVGIILTSLFGIFVGYALLSLFWSPWGAYAVDKAIALVATSAWALGGAALVIATDQRRVRRFLGVALVFALVAAGVTFFNVGRPSDARIGANYIILGRIIGFGTVVAAYQLLYHSRSVIERLVLCSVIGIFCTALAVGGSRAALLTTLVVIVGLGLIAAQSDSSTFSRSFAYAALGGVTVFGALVVFFGWLPHTLARLMTTSIAPGKSLGSRVVYWRDSVQAIGAHPFLGHGLGSWPVVTGAPEARWPHDIILEVLVELGAVGLVLLGVVVVFGLAILRHNARSTDGTGGILLFGLAAFLSLNALISGDINANRYLFAVIGLFAVLRHDFSLLPRKSAQSSETESDLPQMMS